MTPNGDFNYLCQAWGESDLPCVAIALDRNQVDWFIINQWLGDAFDPQRSEIMKEFDDHDWDDHPVLKWTFEIGGVSIERVFDCSFPVDMVLHCPNCGVQHIDKADCVYDHFDPPMEGMTAPEDAVARIAAMKEWERTHTWTNPPHRSHLCHSCGHIWRPADVATNGVEAVKTKGQKDSPIATTFLDTDKGRHTL